MSAKKTSRESAWVREMRRELEFRLEKTGLLRYLGVELALAKRGRVVLRFRVRSVHLQAYRVVHGGVTATLADTAGGLATYMSVPQGTRVATVEMKINFLEPIERGMVTADARVLRCGRNFAVVDCEVRDSAGRLAGKALMTFAHSAAADVRWRGSRNAKAKGRLETPPAAAGSGRGGGIG